MSQPIAVWSADYDGLVDVNSLPGARSVRSRRNRIFVCYSESDFTIKLDRHVSDEHWTATWTVTVREPRPGLGTWWGRWSRSFIASPTELSKVLAAEIRGEASRVRARLGEHLSSGNPDAPTARH